MPAEPPLVIALLPAWNGEKFIAATLDALAAQTYPNLKIIISDDASTDTTPAICEAFASSHDRVQVVRQFNNLGWVGNVNALYRIAFTSHPFPKYLLTAFHDDVPKPTYIERCVEALEANPAASMAFTDITLNWADGHSENISHLAFDGVSNPYLRARSMALQEGDWWVPLRGVVRTTAAQQSGGLRKHRSGEFAADWPWSIHMAVLGELQRVPENLLTKNYRPTSLSRSWNHFAVRPWLGVTWSAFQVIFESPLPLKSKLRLLAPATHILRVRTPMRIGDYTRAVRRRIVDRF
jgi:glycosyltransferase involved in cell wall biosynthesis